MEGSLVEEDSGTGIIQEKVGNKKRRKSIVHDQDQNSDLEGAMGESILDATSDDGEEESEPSCGSDLECENEEKDEAFLKSAIPQKPPQHEKRRQRNKGFPLWQLLESSLII